MAIYATFVASRGAYRLTSTPVDGTSVLIDKPFVTQAYNYITGQGITAVSATKSNQGKNFTITGWSNLTFTERVIQLSLWYPEEPPTDTGL